MGRARAVGSVPVGERAQAVAEIVGDYSARVELVAARGAGAYRDYFRGAPVAITYNYANNGSEGSRYSLVVDVDGKPGEGAGGIQAFSMGTLRWLQPVERCPVCREEAAPLDLMAGAVVDKDYGSFQTYKVRAVSALAAERGGRCARHAGEG